MSMLWCTVSHTGMYIILFKAQQHIHNPYHSTSMSELFCHKRVGSNLKLTRAFHVFFENPSSNSSISSGFWKSHTLHLCLRLLRMGLLVRIPDPTWVQPDQQGEWRKSICPDGIWRCLPGHVADAKGFGCWIREQTTKSFFFFWQSDLVGKIYINM